MNNGTSCCRKAIEDTVSSQRPIYGIRSPQSPAQKLLSEQYIRYVSRELGARHLVYM